MDVLPVSSSTSESAFNVQEYLGHGAHACLTDLLWEQVRHQPDGIAVVSDAEQLSFRELWRLSDHLGAYLCGLGVGADDCVGLFAEPSIELAVGAWGIVCAGGAYLPLSPEYPEERLRYMIEDSRTKVIVTQEKLKQRLRELAPWDTTIITVEQARRSADSTGRRGARVGPRPDSLAYIIYTSGSTGRPKGVMVEHRAIVSQMRWLNREQKLDRSSTLLQKTPMSFDAAQWEILAPGCGTKIIMGPPGVHRDPEQMIDTISRYAVTTLQCTPTLLQALIDTDQLAECKSLIRLYSGGEALSRSLASQVCDALPECELVNLYGPTECTINSSAFAVDRQTLPTGPHTISIGTPVHGTRFYILGGDGCPVPTGEVGELYIGGILLARGYLHQPELTRQRFIANPFRDADGLDRLYQTGDLAYQTPDGAVHFVGRADNQVKLRGVRIELDEVKRVIETHDWVKNAAVVVRADPRTRFQHLIAFIELNPKEAMLMDQGSAGAHHLSKDSKLQIKAQLSNGGCRDEHELAGKNVVDLPCEDPTPQQRARVFARKTYRFFEGGEVRRADVLSLLAPRNVEATPRQPHSLRIDEYGAVLRYFGQYRSNERLLPKYGYASPGALYATQMYWELDGFAGLPSGYYYYHPVRHQLVKIRAKQGGGTPYAKVHFIGKRRAIEPIYKNNIQEVLEIEAGHMVGLFEAVLPEYGLTLAPAEFTPSVRQQLEIADEDYYLGTFALARYSPSDLDSSVRLYVQSHPDKIADLAAGLYQYCDGDLVPLARDVIAQKHVIAINQQVYARSSLGVSVVSEPGPDWLRYLNLGRKLQQLQMNDLDFGFMSSGYSSKSGHDLPAAKRLADILNACAQPTGPCYFFIGGRVSDEQMRSIGMNEDIVHMKGPAEMVRDDLVAMLPEYMIPNKVVVLDRLPQTANGKIDLNALQAYDVRELDRSNQPFTAPRTPAEARIAAIWKKAMRQDAVCVHDDFFASGGNSLIAVSLVNRINREFASSLPLQILFEAPTIEKLAQALGGTGTVSSRMLTLHAEPAGEPIFCWPGLGGYVMNLRHLAGRVDLARPFCGIQAHGINPGEVPFATVKEMARHDVDLIRAFRPHGPYTLWGYSFGARVAFETAYQLETAGEQVRDLFLIAPGSPRVPGQDQSKEDARYGYDHASFVTILFSVFSGTISGPLRDRCLKQAHDEASFTAFITSHLPDLDADLVKRIVRVVETTYSFEYDFRELKERRVRAPITVFKATGDDYSFIEAADDDYSQRPPTVVELAGDHYGILRESGVDELVTRIRARLDCAPPDDSGP